MSKVVTGLLATAMLFAVVSVSVTAADDDKPKYTIKEVMKLHKEKLHEKFQNGEASKDEKTKLQEAYEAMGKNEPPKGEKEDWKKRSEALVKAVKDDDKDGFKKAVNCKDCHSAHKK